MQGWLGETSWWKSWFNSAVLTSSMLGMQILRFGVALIMISAMLVIKKRRSAFFLVKGDLSAAAEPIPLVMTRPEPWSKLGPNLAIFISLGTLAFLVIASWPSLSVLAKALPFLPFVLLFAAMNAFSEEMNYKASFLSVLHEVVGKNQSLLLMAAFFGIGHYYGLPYGIVGVLMAGFLGWLLGKSMLETRGFVWAWFIQFLQDVLIFFLHGHWFDRGWWKIKKILAFLMGKSILETRGVLWAWIIHFVPDVFIFASYALVWVQP